MTAVGWGTRSSRRDRSGVLGRAESWVRRLDWVLLGAVLVLCLLGCLLVWSATKQKLIDEHASPLHFLERDVLNVVVGLVLGTVVTVVDYRSLRAYAPIVYGLSVVGLLAVLVVGSTINGAHSWIVLPGGFELQPSEFAKLALVVGMAMLLGEKRDMEDVPRDGDVLVVLALAAVPMGLILLQPDFGTVLVFVFTILGVLAMSGARARWIVGLIAAGVLLAFVILHFDVLQGYQRDRLLSFTHPSGNLSTTGYNAEQARIAIGSGGWLGKGLFHGTQTNGQFVPEQQTDFVFTVAGEELGFVGAGAVVVLLAVVLVRSIRVARRADDAFGRLVAAGVACWFAFQGFENIGMTLGIMPITGLPLPFVSYGGSAMFANLAAIGLLQNVHARSTRIHPTYP